MLFDLQSGRRRRVVQVVFGFLAFIFFISFVGFGIGSDVSGGIFDALGVGSGSGTSGNAQFDERIDAAEEKLEVDPKDEDALLELAEVRFQAGQFALESDPQTGAPILTDDSRSEFEQSLDAWERYLDLEPKDPKADVAQLVTQAYVLLNDANGAAESQQIVVDDEPTSGNLRNLAFYLYAGGEIEAGDEAAAEAVSKAEPSQRKVVEQQLAQIAERARKIEEQAKEQAKEEGQEGAPPIEDPFGGLGGDTGLGTPTPPAAP